MTYMRTAKTDMLEMLDMKAVEAGLELVWDKESGPRIIGVDPEFESPGWIRSEEDVAAINTVVVPPILDAARNSKDCSLYLRDRAGFAGWAVEKFPQNYKECSDRLRDDIDFSMWAIELFPWNLDFCSDRLKNNPLLNAYKELVMADFERRPVAGDCFSVSENYHFSFSEDLQTARDIASMLFVGENNYESRVAFVNAYNELRAQRFLDPLLAPVLSRHGEDD